LGGTIKDEDRAPPDTFGEWARKLRPVVAQISGGEPLLRTDVYDVVRAIRVPDKPPFVVLTTNAHLLTPDTYYRLRAAGVDEFSVSLDYPDERHDEFRNIPGLFKWIETLIQALKAGDDKAITLSCVVQRDNFRDLPRIAALSQEWGVQINFSTYTWLRTDDKDYLITREDLDEFRDIVRQLLAYRKTNKNFFASPYVFNRMIRFFEEGSIPNCLAGRRFLIVNPSGMLSPCGVIFKYYKTFEEMNDDFVRTNNCGDCNTSMRANCEKPARYLIKDNLRGH
jgi:MoaA/NifB/PqqE/SkfB family radical SAM enzyme